MSEPEHDEYLTGRRDRVEEDEHGVLHITEGQRPPEPEHQHRWILMTEKVVRVNAFKKQRRRRFYCEGCREVAEDRDKEFAG